MFQFQLQDVGSDVSASRAHFVPLASEYGTDVVGSNVTSSSTVTTTSTEPQQQLPQSSRQHYYPRQHYHHHHHHHHHHPPHLHQTYQQPRQQYCNTSPGYMPEYEIDSSDLNAPTSGYQQRPHTSYNGHVRPPSICRSHYHNHQHDSLPTTHGQQPATVLQSAESSFRLTPSEYHHHPYSDEYPGYYMVPMHQHQTSSCNCATSSSSSSETPPPLPTHSAAQYDGRCLSCQSNLTRTSDLIAPSPYQRENSEIGPRGGELHTASSSTNIIFNSHERERPRRRVYEDTSTSSSFVNEAASSSLEMNRLPSRDEDEVASTTSTSMNTLPTEEMESYRGTPYSLSVQPPPNDEVSSASSEAEHVQFAHTRTTNTTTTTSAAAMKKHKSTTTNVVGSSPTSTSSSAGANGGNSSSTVGGSGTTSANESKTKFTNNSQRRRLSDDQPSTSQRLREATFNGNYWQNIDEESNDHTSQAWNLHKPSSSISVNTTTQTTESQNIADGGSNSPFQFQLRYSRSDERERESEDDERSRSWKIQRLNTNHSGAVHSHNLSLFPSVTTATSTQRESTSTNSSNGSYVITYAGHQPPTIPPPPLPPPSLLHRRKRMETITSSEQAQNFVITNHQPASHPIVPNCYEDMDDQPSTSRGRGISVNHTTSEQNIKPPAVLTAPDLQLDWLSDATTTDGDDDEVVFVHSSREPILSIDLTADDESSSMALEMSTNERDERSQHSPTTTLTLSSPVAVSGTTPQGTEWYNMDSMLILSPASVEPQRAHQSTNNGHNSYPFQSSFSQRPHSTENGAGVSRIWPTAPCMDCYLPDQSNEPSSISSVAPADRMQSQTNTNAVIGSSSLVDTSRNSFDSTIVPPCQTTISNSNNLTTSRLRTVWHPYLPEVTSPASVIPPPSIVPSSLPPIPNSPPPIFIVSPYAVADQNSQRYVNTTVGSLAPVPPMGLVGVINLNTPQTTVLPPPTPLYLQPSLQEATNGQRPINPPPPPSHLTSPSTIFGGSGGSSTPNAHQYHPHSIYHHHSHSAHTTTRPHDNHIITHNHHGHTHGLPLPHSLTFLPRSGNHGPPPPYLVHQNLWLRQHNVQEIHRRHMTPTPIDLSSNPLNLTSSFRTRFQQMPNVCSCVHGRNGPVSSLDPVSVLNNNFFLLAY